MQALRRVSILKRVNPLLPITTAACSKSSIPITSNSRFLSSNPNANPLINYLNPNKSKNDNEVIELEKKGKPFLYAASAAAAASLTPAGYAISPTGVLVLSNLPLAAFAFVQASGIAPIRQILKDKDTGDFSPFPFVSLYTNCAIWSLYGVLQSDQTILIANIAGTVMGLIYTGIFAANTKTSMMKYFAGSSGILGIFLSSPFWAQSVGMDAPTILGTHYLHTIYLYTNYIYL